MTISVPGESGWRTPDKAIGRDSAVRETDGRSVSLIVLRGDNPLLIRALDRVLRRAGYAVCLDDRRNADSFPERSASLREGVTLTIIDLSDNRAQPAAGPKLTAGEDSTRSRFLWIGTSSPVPAPEWFLAKPFTAEEFLERVRCLLAAQN